jgi:hypothetical protein
MHEEEGDQVFFAGTGLSMAGAWLVKLRSTSSINFDAVFADTQPSFIACSIAPFSALLSRARATRNSSERRSWLSSRMESIAVFALSSLASSSLRSC